MREHGRLLALKEKLVSIVDEQDPLSINTLSLFQLKDLRCPNIDPKCMDDVTTDQVIKGIDVRQQDMVFQDALLIKSGGSTVEKHIDVIREALINKDGLVP